MGSFRQILRRHFLRWLRPDVTLALSCMVVIGLMWALTFEHLRYERKQEIQHEVSNNDNLALAFEEYTTLSLKSIDKALLLLLHEYARDGRRLDFQKLIKSGLIDAGGNNFFGVIDEHGMLTMGSGTFKPVSLADREHFKIHQQHDNHGMFIGKPQLRRVTGLWAIQMSRRINKPDGSFGGVVLMSVDPGYFTRFSQQANVGEHGAIMLVGLDGIALARQVGSVITFGQDLNKGNLLEAQHKNKNGSYLSRGNLEGMPRLFSYRTLSEYPLVVAVGTVEAEALKEFYARQRNYYLVAALVTALVLAFAFGLTVFLARKKRAELQYGQLFHANPHPMWVDDLDTLRFLAVNDAAVSHYGYTRDEFLAMSVIDIHPPEDVPRLRDAIAHRTNAGIVMAGIWRHRKKDGTLIDVEITSHALQFSGRRALVVLAHDITARKKGEQALRENEVRYRGLYENMLNGFAYCKMQYDDRDRPVDFVYLDVNKAFERLTGLKNVVGKRVTEVIPGIGDLSPELFVTYGRVASTGNPETFEFDFKSLGTLLSISAYSPEKGYFVAIFDDITARKKAEQALRESEDKFRGIFEAALDGILLADADTKRFLIGNPMIYRMLGYSPEETTALGISDIHPEEDLPHATEQFEKMLRGELQLAADIPVKRKDGSVFYADIKAAPVRFGGEICLLGIFRDITERKRSDQALLKVNRALRALSNCNEALIHAYDEDKLLHDMCRVIVEVAGYRLAWVGFAEHDLNKTVRPVGHAGYDEGYIERANVTWADNELGRGPAGIAIRTQKPWVVQNVQTDPGYELWRANAIKIGYGSVGGFPLVSFGKVLGVLCIYSSESNGFEDEEIRLLSELAADLAFGIVTLRTRESEALSAQRLMHSMEDTILAMGAMVEMRDPYTAGHERRVSELSVAIACDMKLTDEEVHGIRLAAEIHDLGKIQVPAEILSKPTKLTALEYGLIKNHPQAGHELLKEIDFPWPIAQIVHQHHERIDGSGYPLGLKGPEILIGARILAVADVVEAMCSHRPYRPGLGIDRALDEIRKNRGRLYDAQAVDSCLKLFEEKRFTFLEPGTLDQQREPG